MAIYHLHVKVVQRSKGKSVVAAAAYRHAARMEHASEKQVYDYTDKQDVIFGEMLIPLNAPTWLHELVTHDVNASSERLWNLVETIEKRKDAQLAREIEFALPLELTQTQNIELAREFIQKEFVALGMLADWSVHYDEGNPHVHVLLSMRELTQTGFGQKVTDWNRKELLQTWRERWSMHANHHLHKHNIDARIDHRSYRELGINLVPTYHEGRATQDMNMRGIDTDIMKEAREIKRQNLRLIAANPSTLLDKLTHTKSNISSYDVVAAISRYASMPATSPPFLKALDESLQEGEVQSSDAGLHLLIQNICKTLEEKDAVFSERDLAKAVSSHTQDADAFAKALIALKTSPELIHLGLGDDGRERYTSARMLEAEYDIQDLADKLRETSHKRINLKGQAHLLAQYETALDKKLTDEQLAAVNHMLHSPSIACVVGRAGTGKSFSLGAANAVWAGMGMHVHGIALSGIAADGLVKDAHIDSRTIASFCYALEEGHLTLGKRDVVVMDEAGMTDSVSMLAVLQAVQKAGAKLVLVGDSAQLQPVGAGATFRALLERVGFVEIHTIYRQTISWQREATSLFAKGDVTGALQAYHQHNMVNMLKTPDEAMAKLVADWHHTYTSSDKSLDKYLVLAHRNEDVKALNHLIRQARVKSGELAEGYEVMTKQGRIAIAQGDRLLCLKNKRKLGLSNGRFMTVTNVNMSESGRVIDFTVRLDGQDHDISIDPNTYMHFTYGYAATVHKSQGVTVDNSYVYAGGFGWNRHLSYVAGSRHREFLKIYADSVTHGSIEKLGKTLGRYGLKDSVLDFPLAFAARRNIDIEAKAKGLSTHLSQRLQAFRSKLEIRYQRVLEPLGLVKRPNLKPGVSDAAIEIKQTRRMEARMVAAYQDAHQLAGESFKEVLEAAKALGLDGMSYQKDEFALISKTRAYQAYLKDIAARDKLAFGVTEDLARYTGAIDANRIDIDILHRHADMHLKREVIHRYQEKVAKGATLLQGKLASKIAKDIQGFYGLMGQANISVADVKAHARAYELRVLALNLTKHQRELLKIAISYDVLSRKLNKDWYDNKDKKEEMMLYEKANMLEKQSLERDALAAKLVLNAPYIDPILDSFEIGRAKPIENSRFQTQTDADKAANLRWIRLQQAAARHEGRANVEAYYEAWTKGDTGTRLKVAHLIMQAPSAHHGAIMSLPTSTQTIWQAIRRDAKALAELGFYQTLDKEERKVYKALKRYVDAKKAHGLAWREVLSSKEDNTKCDERAALSASRYTEARNQLASVLAMDAKKLNMQHAKLLEHFGINMEDLEPQAHAHACLQVVQDYISGALDKTKSPLVHSQLAKTIIESPEDYKKHIRSYQLDWKTLYRDAKLADRKAYVDFLTDEEKHLYRINRRYKEANRNLGKFMQRYGDVLNTGGTLKPKEKSTLNHLVAKRNYMAYRLCEQVRQANPNLHLEGYRDFLKIDPQKIKKQANDHRDHVQKLNIVQQKLKTMRAELYAVSHLSEAMSPEVIAQTHTSVQETQRLIRSFRLHQNLASYHYAMLSCGVVPHHVKTDLVVLDKASKALSKSIPTHDDKTKTQDVSQSITPSAYSKKSHVETKLQYHKVDSDTIRALLNERAQEVVGIYLGAPKSKRHNTWRFGSKSGSLVVQVDGAKQGEWYDFQRGVGGDMLKLMMDVTGQNYKDALSDAKRIVGYDEESIKPIIVHHKRTDAKTVLDEDIQAKIDKVRDIVSQTIPIAGTLAEQYLKTHRRIEALPSDSLRFHPGLYNSETKGYLPSLVAVAKDVKGQVYAIQSTYLDANTAGKAKLDTVKITRGSLKTHNAAVTIQTGDDGTIAIAEGVETALSVASARPDWSVYATLGISNFARAPIPEGTTSVIFCADNDGVGSASDKALEKAAATLSEQGIDVYMTKPSLIGQDFNDVLKQEGIAGVRTELSQATLFKAAVRQLSLQDELKTFVLSQAPKHPMEDQQVPESLLGILHTYVELRLLQNRLLKEMHSIRAKDPAQGEVLANELAAHANKLQHYTLQAIKQPFIQEAMADLQKIRTQSLHELGGLDAIYQRLQTSTLSQADISTLVAELGSQAKSAKRSLSQKEDRGRDGGRSQS